LSEDEVDLAGSIFVGDAGGRPVEERVGGAKKDHSCSDRYFQLLPFLYLIFTYIRDFAANVGIPFHTPDEFFLKQPPRPFVRPFEPSQHLAPIANSTDASPIVFSKLNHQDIVLFVGSPASGKSTFYNTHLKPLDYIRVNQDILKTRDKCVKVATSHLSDGNSVLIDATNADRDVRKVWIDLAKRFGVPIRCVWFTAGDALCRHNDAVRALNEGVNPEKRSILPSMAFSGFRSRFQEPSVAEGFTDITKVDFAFEGTDEERKIWSMYWV
jgi:bifunctional polynucleotide phosphatase/kinase